MIKSTRTVGEATQRVLLEETWRSERIINLFRSSLWLLIGLGAAMANRFLFHRPAQGSLWAIGWGLICAVLGIAWLRKRFHPLAPAAFSVGDITVLSLVLDIVMTNAERTTSLVPTNQYIGVMMGYMLLLAANAMRFSWLLSLSLLILSVAASLLVHALHNRLSVFVLVPSVMIVAIGAVLSWNARKLLHIIHLVMERDAFARFLPGPAIERLSRDPAALRLGGDEHTMTVLFSDIRGFTSLSAEMPPEAVVQMLNEYFSEMVDEVFRWNGVLDKFLGDGICAVFGPPFLGEEHARNAVCCALGMLTRLQALNERRTSRGAPPLKIGIGLHTGPVIAGNVGSPSRMEFTHIGDTVNTASRIEGQTKDLNGALLISNDTYLAAGGPAALNARLLGQAKLRGRREPVELFAVDSVAGSAPNNVRGQ